jgi:hypothetical protein
MANVTAPSLVDLIREPDLMCTRYHRTPKPYWVTVLHVFFFQGVISFLVMGNKVKRQDWYSAPATRLAKLVLVYQLATSWLQMLSIFSMYAEDGASSWENYSRYSYLVCSSSAIQTGIQLAVSANMADAAPSGATLTTGGQRYYANDGVMVEVDGKRVLVVCKDDALGEPLLGEEEPGGAMSATGAAGGRGACGCCKRLFHRLSNSKLGKWLNGADANGTCNVDALRCAAALILAPALPTLVTHCGPMAVAYCWVVFVPLAVFEDSDRFNGCRRRLAALLQLEVCEPSSGRGPSRLRELLRSCSDTFAYIFIFCTCSTYGILLWMWWPSGPWRWSCGDARGRYAPGMHCDGSYLENIDLEWRSHSTGAYFRCVGSKLLHEWASFTDVLAMT